MSRKLFSLITCLVLVLNFGVVSGVAQADEGGEFVIRPTSIQPPDGSVDIYVPLGDNVIIRTGWGACTRGLAQAWTKQNKISFWVNGESVFSLPKEAQVFWGEPESFLLPDGSSCVNDVDSGWRVYWEYPFGELAEGTYIIHYEENVDHPFLDGGDYDGDGKPDIDEWHISVDFNIIVMEVGSISGTVYEANSGDPLATIAGVHVDACSTDDTFCNGTETNELGEYTIAGLPADKEYRVFIWGQPGWANEVYQETIWWDEATIVSPDATGIDFTLDPGGSISGVVTDEGGNPLANIGVDIMDGGYGACTDTDGNYTIAGLPFGTYNVAAGRDFCEPHEYVEELVFGVEINEITPDVGEINFTLELGGSISGTVTTVDVEGNTVPVTELWVDACHESVSLEMWGNSPLCIGAQTDQDGFYTIPRLLPGNYRVVTWGNNDLSLQFYDGVLNYYEANLVTVETGQIRESVDFSLFASGPAFNAWPVENYVDGWGWEIGVPVNLTILRETSTVYTDSQNPFYPEWSQDTPWVIFESLKGFDLQPGDIVTLDNGIHLKQHKVTLLEIIGTDLTTSSVSGTAEPYSHVYVWYYSDEGRVDRHEVANESGNWTANFSVQGDEPGEEQTYTIPAGAGGEANQVDFDGDGTQVNWWMEEP